MLIRRKLFINSILLLIIFLTGCMPLFNRTPASNIIVNPCKKWGFATSQNIITGEDYYDIVMISDKLYVQADKGIIYIDKSPDEKLRIKNKKLAIQKKFLDKILLSIQNSNQETIITANSLSNNDTLVAYPRLKLYIPNTIKDIDIEADAVNLTIENINANLNIVNLCGTTELKQNFGETHIISDYGNINITGKNGNIEVISDGGDIYFDGLISPDCTYSLSTGLGLIYFAPQNQIGKIFIYTNTGLIDLGERLTLGDKYELPAQVHLANTLDLVSQYSNIELDGYEEREDRKISIMAKLGEGNAKIILETIEGNIQVR